MTEPGQSHLASVTLLEVKEVLRSLPPPGQCALHVQQPSTALELCKRGSHDVQLVQLRQPWWQGACEGQGAPMA